MQFPALSTRNGLNSKSLIQIYATEDNIGYKFVKLMHQLFSKLLQGMSSLSFHQGGIINRPSPSPLCGGAVNSSLGSNCKCPELNGSVKVL